MSHKILLIDDSVTQLESFRIKFERLGYDVVTATDGALGYQKVFQEAPDVILCDIIMPALTGYQLCRLLKNNKLTKDIPVMLLTVLDKKIDKFWANKSGADKFLLKNINFSEIEQATKDLIEIYPVYESYKESLKNSSEGKDSVQNQASMMFDEMLKSLTLVNEFRDLNEFLPQEKVLVEKIFFLLSSFIDYNVAGIFFNTLDVNEKNILYMDINKSPVSNFVLEKIKREFFTSLPTSKPFNIRDFGHDIICERTEDDKLIISDSQFKSSHILPIITEGNLLGGICFYNRDEFDYPNFKFYRMVINEFYILYRMKYLYSEREHLSVTDGLTGLYNRRHFETNLEREFIRTKRYPCDLSLALIDIDYFKQVNDTYGHQFGDYVLKEISSILMKSFRKTDMIYRYGGEELTVILTETSMEKAVIPLERLRETIAEHVFSYNGEETRITISIGVGMNTSSVNSEKELIECADKALYRAKQEGRNKVITYDDEDNAVE